MSWLDVKFAFTVKILAREKLGLSHFGSGSPLLNAPIVEVVASGPMGRPGKTWPLDNPLVLRTLPDPTPSPQSSKVRAA